MSRFVQPSENRSFRPFRDTRKACHRDANGNIVRFETASVTDQATGLVQFSSLGQATFSNNQLTFGDGSVWAKGVSLNPTTGGSGTPSTSGSGTPSNSGTSSGKFHFTSYSTR